MFDYCSKKDFICSLFLNEHLKNKIDVIQTNSKSCLVEKNKSFFLSDQYLAPVFDLSAEELVILKLPGYQISNNPANYPYIRRAIAKIGIILDEPLNVIKQHTSYLAIIEPQLNKACDIISSTTFYDYPFCIFFTRYGFSFIPPNIVFQEPNDYAIFENIYHEALHQKLLIQILLGKIFVSHDSLNHEKFIPIPWRNSKWSIEHTLQAAYVYIHLYHSRLEYSLTLDNWDELSKMKAAIAHSKRNSIYLFTQLIQLKNIFTQEAIFLIRQLIFENQLAEDI